MEILKLRSGSSGAGHRAQSRSTKGTSVSSDSSDSKPSKVLERKSSSKGSSLPEKRVMKATEMQQQMGQLQEELRIAKEERSQAFRELEEVKKEIPRQRNENEVSPQTKKRIEMLEIEAEKAKDSERKMLESLIFQTKQLEQTKISLEEAKLEIRSLHESHSEKRGPEIGVLRNELKLAMEAEGKSKKAMDDLAIALKEVTTESNQMKGKLSSTESKLEKVGSEAERLRSLLNITEDKYRAAVEESERVKMDFEESVSSWNKKEDVFINSMKASEEEITKAKEENDKLIDSQRVLREDNSRLRDILKQAVNEATVVKETLEIARTENSRLNDLLSKKDNNLQSIKQEYECLKVSEAASLDSVRELKSLLAATSTMDSSRIDGPTEIESSRRPNETEDEVIERESMAKLASDHLKNENPRARNPRRHSIGEPAMFKELGFVAEGSKERKNRMFASVSNLTVSKVPSSLFTDDVGSVNLDDYDYLDRNQLSEAGYDCSSNMKEKTKKKPMFRRFGDMLKRRSFHR